MKNKFSLCYHHYSIESYSNTFKLYIHDNNITNVKILELYESHLKFVALINLVHNLDDFIFKYDQYFCKYLKQK